MTIRLVGLMSAVLLVSLAAFAFLGHRYQDQVMEELARTVSTTGRETLRALEIGLDGAGDGGAGDAGAGDGGGPTLAGAAGPADDVVVTKGSAGTTIHASALDLVSRSGAFVTAIASSTEDCEKEGDVVVFTREVRTRKDDGGVLVRRKEVERIVHGEAAETAPSPVVAAAGTDTAPGTVVARGAKLEVRVIRLADVRAEPDSADGLVLKIPTHAAAEGEETPPGHAYAVQWVSRTDDADPAEEPVAASPGHPATPFELRLPIPTAEYQTLFTSLRRGSLATFLGVLLVGMTLSTGLAARFTRPIRRLDAGIRRLSAGDLEVMVDVEGPPEVGRLARAFNDMAGSLRAAREREREVTRRERLSSLGRLAAGVAHDVRNPLHSIGLTLQNLQESCRPEDPGRVRDFDHSVGVIREEIGRLDRLVTGFLQFARSDRGPRRPLDLAAMLRETARLVEHEAGRRRVAVELSLEDEEVPPVPAAAESVRSSVLNLVLNSFEAMPEGGRVGLRLRRAGDEALVEVEDTGPGIPEEERERVFEFAYTTKESGHGLGLPMVHQVVVEDHGGRIAVEGRPGGGTRIVLAFPLGPPAGVAAGEGAAS